MKKVTKTYSNFATVLLLLSYIIGFGVWIWSVITAYFNAGIIWTFAGLLFAGVGVVLVAVISTTLNKLWITSALILISFIATLSLRKYAKSLAIVEIKEET